MKCTSSPWTVEASSSSACWLSTTNFVNTTLKLNSKITQINIVYSVKDIVEDKFGKVGAIPLLIVITDDIGKQVWDYNTIIEKYGEEIKITLPKPDRSKNGYANIQIKTESSYSEKYDTYYYQRQYGDITNKVITKAIESQEQKQEHDKVEVLDI